MLRPPSRPRGRATAAGSATNRPGNPAGPAAARPAATHNTNRPAAADNTRFPAPRSSRAAHTCARAQLLTACANRPAARQGETVDNLHLPPWASRCIIPPGTVDPAGPCRAPPRRPPPLACHPLAHASAMNVTTAVFFCWRSSRATADCPGVRTVRSPTRQRRARDPHQPAATRDTGPETPGHNPPAHPRTQAQRPPDHISPRRQDTGGKPRPHPAGATPGPRAQRPPGPTSAPRQTRDNRPGNPRPHTRRRTPGPQAPAAPDHISPRRQDNRPEARPTPAIAQPQDPVAVARNPAQGRGFLGSGGAVKHYSRAEAWRWPGARGRGMAGR